MELERSPRPIPALNAKLDEERWTMPEVKSKFTLMSITPDCGPLIEKVVSISYQTQRFAFNQHPKMIKFASGRQVPYEQFKLDEEPPIGKTLPGYKKDDHVVAEIIPASYEKVVKFLIAVGHHTPLQYCNAVIMLENITRKSALHLLRYDYCTFNMQSQKYQPQDDFNYLLPGTFDTPPPGVRRTIQNYMGLAQQAYEELRKTGVDTEWSRCMYPNNVAQTMTMGTNFRQWRHLFDCLCDDDYVGEDQYIAVECLKLLKAAEPVFFFDYEISEDGRSAARRGRKYSRNKHVNWSLTPQEKKDFGLYVHEEVDESEIP
jgi:thymidylate synthase ThyX